jgi:hypothetical protein
MFSLLSGPELLVSLASNGMNKLAPSIGIERRADLYDIRAALKSKRIVRL